MQVDSRLSRTAENISKFHGLKGIILIGIGENNAVMGVHGLDYVTVQTLIDALKETVTAPKGTIIKPVG